MRNTLGAPGQQEDPLFISATGMAQAVNYTDWTFSLVSPLIKGDVLEVGCGVGTFTRLLLASPNLHHLLSIDASDAAIEHCSARFCHSSLELRHADINKVVGSFDLVVCMNVLEHIEDDEQALRHMISLVRRKGALFLLVPAHDFLYSEFDSASGHFRRYNKRRMRAVLGRIPDCGGLRVRMFYFNMIGALGYLVVYRLFKKEPRADASAEIGWFDRVLVPIQRRFERLGVPFGISLVTIVTAPAE